MRRRFLENRGLVDLEAFEAICEDDPSGKMRLKGHMTRRNSLGHETILGLICGSIENIALVTTN